MTLINVNQSLCIKCGICSKVCPSSVLSVDENGPQIVNSDNCIACGQCVAACPYAAIDNIKTPLNNQIDIKDFPIIDSNTAEHFLRARRSIRCYKDTTVPDEKLLELINIARFAPTASNSQGLSYIVITNREKLMKATILVVEWMEEQLKKSYHHWSFSRHVNNYRTYGIDTILRDAPHLILAIAPKTFTNGRSNTISALSYTELFATSLGLGSCWAGLFELCAFSGYDPLLKLFNIPNDKTITGAIMVGYPKYTYKRLVDRDPLDVTFIS